MKKTYRQKNGGRPYYGSDGLIHDDYGDNTAYHRIGGTYQMSPWWFNRSEDKSRKKCKGPKKAKR